MAGHTVECIPVVGKAITMIWSWAAVASTNSFVFDNAIKGNQPNGQTAADDCPL